MSDFLSKFSGLDRTIPDIRIQLPYSGKEILMRPFNTKEQISIVKCIEKQDYDLVQLALDELLKSCVINEDFNLDEISSKERDLLLIYLIIESISEEFSFYWDCEAEATVEQKEDGPKDAETEEETQTCDHQNIAKVDLSTLEIEPPQSEMEMDIKLKDRDCEIKMGIAFRGPEREGTEYIKSKREELLKEDKELSENEVVNVVYAVSIRSVTMEGQSYTDLSLEDRLEIINSLHLDDRKIIENFANSIKGLEYKLEKQVKCSKCGATQEEELDWMSFFI